MEKYVSIFKISFAQEFAYRINFIMWRIRNVMQIFLVFFLWDSVFGTSGRVVFGYDRSKILTYIFGLVVMKAVVTSSRTIDIPGEISDGKLSNYLLKPFNYFRYWFTRDMSSKSLNLIFASIEVIFLYFLLKPPFYFQSNLLLLALFLISLGLAVLLYFLLIVLFGISPIWFPEQGWGPIFLFLILVEFLAGGMFPLDILPSRISSIIYLTPFPYLLFVPLQIYLGKFELSFIFRSLAFALAWVLIMIFLVKKLWNLGLKVYSSEGR